MNRRSLLRLGILAPVLGILGTYARRSGPGPRVTTLEIDRPLDAAASVDELLCDHRRSFRCASMVTIEGRISDTPEEIRGVIAMIGRLVRSRASVHYFARRYPDRYIVRILDA